MNLVGAEIKRVSGADDFCARCSAEDVVDEDVAGDLRRPKVGAFVGCPDQLHAAVHEGAQGENAAIEGLLIKGGIELRAVDEKAVGAREADGVEEADIV